MGDSGSPSGGPLVSHRARSSAIHVTLDTTRWCKHFSAVLRIRRPCGVSGGSLVSPAVAVDAVPLEATRSGGAMSKSTFAAAPAEHTLTRLS